MEKKEIIDKVIEILSKHEEHTSEEGIYWEYEWVGGKQIPDDMGGYKQVGGERVSAEEAFYKEMTDFISQELDKAREEGRREGGKGMLEGFLKHLENRVETEHSIRGKIELSKDLFALYDLWDLVEDVSDDGDGDLELTSSGEKVIRLTVFLLEEKEREVINKLKKEMGVYIKASSKYGYDMLVPNYAVENFIYQELNRAREEELLWVLKNGSGGGNWRRLVNSRLVKLEKKE